MNNFRPITNVEDLKRERITAKHQLDIEKLEFENSKLKLQRELDGERILNDASQRLTEYINVRFISKLVTKLFK
jgi:hypothetical protein